MKGLYGNKNQMIKFYRENGKSREGQHYLNRDPIKKFLNKDPTDISVVYFIVTI